MSEFEGCLLLASGFQSLRGRWCCVCAAGLITLFLFYGAFVVSQDSELRSTLSVAGHGAHEEVVAMEKELLRHHLCSKGRLLCPAPAQPHLASFG